MSSSRDSATGVCEANVGKPIMGLVTLVLLVVANMIGASIYVSSAFSMSDLGDAKLILLLWLVAGIMAICGSIGYGALARRLPTSGGEYLYLSRLVHPLVGFLAGWISLAAGFTAPIANSAKVAAEYLVSSDWPLWLSKNAIASLAIVLAALAHGFRVRLGAWTQNTIVFAKLALIVLFLVVAVLVGPVDGWQNGNFALSSLPKGAELGLTLYSCIASLIWVVLAYTGFNAAIYVAGEAPSAQSLVPKAMLLATVIVTLLYLGLNTVFLYAIPAEMLAGNTSFVADVARAIGGSWMEWSMRTVIVLSQLTSVFAMLMTGPRVYAQMAADGYLPKWLSMKGGIPRSAIGVQALLSLSVVWIANLESLLSYLGLTLTLCGAMAIASGWWIRKRIPQAPSLKWYEHGSMAVFVVSALVILVASAKFKPAEFYTCLGTFAIGVLIYCIAKMASQPNRVS